MINLKFLFPKILFLIVVIFTATLVLKANDTNFRIVVQPNGENEMTKTIQEAINQCNKQGGGTIFLTEGTYLCRTLFLKSNLTIILSKGAILKGSSVSQHYKRGAFIYGKNLSNITIKGEGIIDGVNCINKRGEEGFRGPHCIRLKNCSNIVIKNITIINSANWAINLRHCSFGTVDSVTIKGGHDGLHTRFCNDFTVTKCDFRTGDDAFAGNDNRDFNISDCIINTSCNGFRIGCLNLTVKRCKLYGPGEHIHKISKRNNMLSAFVYFSPKDEHPKLTCGNWLFQDIVIENVDHVFNYNFKNGLWQTGRPLTNIKFENITASNILTAFNIIGDYKRCFKLEINESSFKYREGTRYVAGLFENTTLLSPTFFNIMNFDSVKLTNSIFEKIDDKCIMSIHSGNFLSIKNVQVKNNSDSTAFQFNNIKEILNNEITRK